jgi:hypothetical protein
LRRCCGGGAAAGTLAVIVAAVRPMQRQQWLLTAGALFLPIGILGILSVGIFFLVQRLSASYLPNEYDLGPPSPRLQL